VTLSAPSSISPSVAAPPSPPLTGAPTAGQFPTLISLLLNEDNSAPEDTKKGKDPSADSQQNTTALAPTTQPIPMPAVLRLHFCLSLASPAKPSNAAQDNSSTLAPIATNLQTQLPAIAEPLPKQAPVELKPLALPAIETNPTSSRYELAFSAKIREITPAPAPETVTPPTPKNSAPAPVLQSSAPVTPTATPALDAPPPAPLITKPDELKSIAQTKSSDDKSNQDKSDSNANPPALPLQATRTTFLPVAPLQTNPAPPTSSRDVEPARPPVAAPPEPTLQPKTEPLRDLAIRLSPDGSGQVDLKIQERAGEVHVAVHSASPELTSDLRQHIGDLVTNLDRSGFRTETYKPTAETSSATASRSAGQSAHDPQQDLPGRQQSQQHQQQQQPFGRPRKSKQPQWLTEMNNVEGIQSK
jgi:hypothetical protein